MLMIYASPFCSLGACYSLNSIDRLINYTLNVQKACPLTNPSD